MSQPWDPNTGQPPNGHQAGGQPTPGQPGGYYQAPDQPGYPPTPGYYQQQPGYAQPQAGQPYSPAGYPTAGFPPAGYPGYPPVPAGPVRPGAVTAAAVLAFVQGGVVLISGIVLLSVVNEVSRRVEGYSGGKAEAWLVTIAVLAAGALLIAGGVRILKGPTGVITGGAVLSLLISVYFLVRSEFNAAVVWLALSYAVLPIIVLAFALGVGARSWAARST